MLTLYYLAISLLLLETQACVYQDPYIRMFTATFHNIHNWKPFRSSSTSMGWMMSFGTFIYLNTIEQSKYLNYSNTEQDGCHRYNCLAKEEFTKDKQTVIPFIQNPEWGTQSCCLGILTSVVKL